MRYIREGVAPGPGLGWFAVVCVLIGQITLGWSSGLLGGVYLGYVVVACFRRPEPDEVLFL